jgi:hypothetical protein
MFPGIIFITLATLVLLVATITFLWEVLKKISPDDVKGFRFFLTFVVVFVPLFTLISFEGAAVIYNATASQLDMLGVGATQSALASAPGFRSRYTPTCYGTAVATRWRARFPRHLSLAGHRE